jgi:hypothetical protein
MSNSVWARARHCRDDRDARLVCGGKLGVGFDRIAHGDDEAVTSPVSSLRSARSAWAGCSRSSRTCQPNAFAAFRLLRWPRECGFDDIWNAMMPSLNACAGDATTSNPIVTMVAAIDLLITEILP